MPEYYVIMYSIQRTSTLTYMYYDIVYSIQMTSTLTYIYYGIVYSIQRTSTLTYTYVLWYSILYTEDKYSNIYICTMV